MTNDTFSVDLQTARAELEAGNVMMIDIRESHEHQRGVAVGALLIPMSQLGGRLNELPTDPAQRVLIICNTHVRSRNVAAALRERGHSNVKFVVGGMAAWAMNGWPTVAPG